MTVNVIPGNGRLSDDLSGGFLARKTSAVLPRKRGPLSHAETFSKRFRAHLLDVFGQKHAADYNTPRVASAMPSNTICSVNELGQLMHNLCMAAVKHDIDILAVEQWRRILAARKDHDWTQDDLAKATGWNSNKSAQEQPNALSASRG